MARTQPIGQIRGTCPATEDRFFLREFFVFREDDQCTTPEWTLGNWCSRRYNEVRVAAGLCRQNPETGRCWVAILESSMTAIGRLRVHVNGRFADPLFAITRLRLPSAASRSGSQRVTAGHRAAAERPCLTRAAARRIHHAPRVSQSAARRARCGLAPQTLADTLPPRYAEAACRSPAGLR
jgi:hypothetical protein